MNDNNDFFNLSGISAQIDNIDDSMGVISDGPPKNIEIIAVIEEEIG